jgi:hypothetical protein
MTDMNIFSPLAYQSMAKVLITPIWFINALNDLGGRKEVIRGLSY